MLQAAHGVLRRTMPVAARFAQAAFVVAPNRDAMEGLTRRLLGLLLAAGALSASTHALAAERCSERVLHDWRQDGAIRDAYSISCLREAQRNLPEDVRLYSSAADDITRALAHHVAVRGTSSTASPANASTETTGTQARSFDLFTRGTALALAGIAVAVALTIGLRRERRRPPRPQA